MKYNLAILFIIFALVITACTNTNSVTNKQSNPNLAIDKENVQLKIQSLEEKFPVLTQGYCFFEDQGDSFRVKCYDELNRNPYGSATTFVSYKDDKILTIAGCSRNDCSYTNQSNPETIIDPIKKSSNIKLYTDYQFMDFHTCSKLIGNGKTEAATSEEYTLLFTHSMENCKLLFSNENSVNYDYCLRCLARKTNNIDLCLNWEGEEKYPDGMVSKKDICLRYAAPYLGDLNNCNKIENKIQRDWCILELAREQNNKNICYELPNGGITGMGADRRACLLNFDD